MVGIQLTDKEIATRRDILATTLMECLDNDGKLELGIDNEQANGLAAGLLDHLLQHKYKGVTQ